MGSKRKRREFPVLEHRCPGCGYELHPFWYRCPDCGRRLEWPDDSSATGGGQTGAECYYCGWVVSHRFIYCPWCGRDIEDESSSLQPLKAPKGFKYHARCDWGCGGGVMYPMQFCPWCGHEQSWVYDEFDSACPHCDRGADDWMDYCPWCGKDATGRDLIPRALRQARRLLVASRIKDWGYRVLLRPGVSGVDPKYPNIVEIERRYVTGKRRRDEISWNMLVGLIVHELGHSFLYHHWSWTRTGRFRRAFGEVREAYRGVDDVWVDFQRRRVATTFVDYVSAYASTHPQEDFAETFRFYVTRRGRLRELFSEFGRKRKGVIVYEKFLVLHDFVRSLRGWT